MCCQENIHDVDVSLHSSPDHTNKFSLILGSQILLYEGRMKKEDYDPNLDDRMEKYLATKAGR